MRLLQLASKEIGDAYRSRRLHLLVVMFGLIGAAIGYVVNQNHVQGLVFMLAFLVPLVGLLFTQHTIVQKRTSGELSVLLSLPFSRREVIGGTVLGRTAVVLLTLLSIFATTAVFSSVSGSIPSPTDLLAAFVITAVLGAIFVGIAVGISASARTGAGASVLAFIAYLLFAFQLWSLLPEAVLYLINGFSIAEETPTWAEVFNQLSPFAAVRNAVLPVAPDLVEEFPLAASSVPDDPPIYMQSWFASFVAIAWFVLPVLGGYIEFERRDL